MDGDTVTVGWTPPQNVQPPQPAVNVKTPYNPGGDWDFSSWVLDAETQTEPLQDTAYVREVLVNMVLNRLQTKGLPLVTCPHTKGLQLDNIINGIVDSHSITCTPQSHQHGFQQQQQIYQPVTQQQGVVYLVPQQSYQQDSNLNTDQDGMAQVISLGESSSSSVLPQVSDQSEPIQTQSSSKRPSNDSDTTSPKTPKRRKPLSDRFDHKCDKCDKTFETNRLLQRHVTVHSQNRPFKCEKCDYRSKNAYECGRHYRRVHLNKYPFYCMTCGKGYGSKSNLLRHETEAHLKVPDKEKPFICKHCDKGFLLNRQLNDHLALHEKDKQFKCDLCPHTSACRRTRRRHINQTHNVFSSRVSNKCLECDLELHEYHILIEHMKQNHEIAGIKCEECGAMFKNESMLQIHMKKEHWTEEMKLEEERKKKAHIDNLKVLVRHKKKLGKKTKHDEKANNEENDSPETKMKFKSKYDVLTASLEKRSLQLEKMVKSSLNDEESIGDSEDDSYLEDKPSKRQKKKLYKHSDTCSVVSFSVDGEETVFFQCNICRGLYTSRREMNSHYDLHHNENLSQARYKTKTKRTIIIKEDIVNRNATQKRGIKQNTKRVKMGKNRRAKAGTRQKIETVYRLNKTELVKEGSSSYVKDQIGIDKNVSVGQELVTSPKQSIIVVKKQFANQGFSTSESSNTSEINVKKDSKDRAANLEVLQHQIRRRLQMRTSVTAEDNNPLNQSDVENKLNEEQSIESQLTKSQQERTLERTESPKKISADTGELEKKSSSSTGKSTCTKESSPNLSKSIMDSSQNTRESTNKLSPNTIESIKSSPNTSGSTKKLSPNTIESTKKLSPNTIESIKSSPNTSESTKKLSPNTIESIKSSPNTSGSTKELSSNTSKSIKKSSPNIIESIKLSPNTRECTKELSPNSSESTKKPQKYLTIYSKSPDQVVKILKKGKVKLSLQVKGTSQKKSVALSLGKINDKDSVDSDGKNASAGTNHLPTETSAVIGATNISSQLGKTSDQVDSSNGTSIQKELSEETELGVEKSEKGEGIQGIIDNEAEKQTEES